MVVGVYFLSISCTYFFSYYLTSMQLVTFLVGSMRLVLFAVLLQNSLTNKNPWVCDGGKLTPLGKATNAWLRYGNPEEIWRELNEEEAIQQQKQEKEEKQERSALSFFPNLVNPRKDLKIDDVGATRLKHQTSHHEWRTIQKPSRLYETLKVKQNKLGSKNKKVLLEQVVPRTSVKHQPLDRLHVTPKKVNDETSRAWTGTRSLFRAKTVWKTNFLTPPLTIWKPSEGFVEDSKKARLTKKDFKTALVGSDNDTHGDVSLTVTSQQVEDLSDGNEAKALQPSLKHETSQEEVYEQVHRQHDVVDMLNDFFFEDSLVTVDDLERDLLALEAQEKHDASKVEKPMWY